MANCWQIFELDIGDCFHLYLAILKTWSIFFFEIPSNIQQSSNNGYSSLLVASLLVIHAPHLFSSWSVNGDGYVGCIYSCKMSAVTKFILTTDVRELNLTLFIIMDAALEGVRRRLSTYCLACSTVRNCSIFLIGQQGKGILMDGDNHFNHTISLKLLL